MALATPEFLQTKTYSALRDRLAFQHGGAIQAGAWDVGDLKATQRASSANMSVDVAAGFALVSANDPGNQGLYHVQNDATVNVPQPTSAHATLPRIDSLYVQVNDTTHGGDASDGVIFGWATGTATSGATLDNRSGAVNIPTGALRLADVLVPAAATSMTTANIRDRRTWARGLHARTVVTSSTSSGGGSWAALNGLGTMRVEQSGAPYMIRTMGGFYSTLNGGAVTMSYIVARITRDGSVYWQTGAVAVTAVNQVFTISDEVYPSLYATDLGSHLYAADGFGGANFFATNFDLPSFGFEIKEFPGGPANNAGPNV